MTGNQLIDGLVVITEQNQLFVQKKMMHLSEEQLNWKLNDSTWSLNEIFAHLNEYALFYHAAFEKKIATTRFKIPTDNFVSTPLGSAAWKSMKLGKANNVKRKFKALSAFNPSNNTILVKGNDWQFFLDGQSKLLEILDNARQINIRKAKTMLSISKIIKFRMGDTFNFVVYHNERHIQQAKNVLNHPQFPKKK